jgi:hypothetical protein
MNSQATICGRRSFVIGSLGRNVVVPIINNHHNELYDEVQIGFEVYYNPAHWNQANKNTLKVKIN